MEPLIKLNNKNNLFDRPIHETIVKLLNVNQYYNTINNSSSNKNQQNSVYVLSVQQRTQSKQNVAKKQAHDKNGIGEFSDGGHHQFRSSQLLIL
jgi:hypothetical protein